MREIEIEGDKENKKIKEHKSKLCSCCISNVIILLSSR